MRGAAAMLLAGVVDVDGVGVVVAPVFEEPVASLTAAKISAARTTAPSAPPATSAVLLRYHGPRGGSGGGTAGWP